LFVQASHNCDGIANTHHPGIQLKTTEPVRSYIEKLLKIGGYIFDDISKETIVKSI